MNINEINEANARADRGRPNFLFLYHRNMEAGLVAVHLEEVS